MKHGSHIALILSLLALIYACSGPRIIPKAKFANIYAEMLLADARISQANKEKVADTSLVYLPILEKYGYTLQDYVTSVDKYMEDPVRFSRIFDQSVKILQRQLPSIDREIHQRELEDSLKREENIRRSQGTLEGRHARFVWPDSVMGRRPHPFDTVLAKRFPKGTVVIPMQWDSVSLHTPDSSSLTLALSDSLSVSVEADTLSVNAAPDSVSVKAEADTLAVGSASGASSSGVSTEHRPLARRRRPSDTAIKLPAVSFLVYEQSFSEIRFYRY